VKKSTVVVVVILSLVVVFGYWAAGLLKKQRARDAIESVETSCLLAQEHGGVDVALLRQFEAKSRIEALDYEDQPLYRTKLNEAWEDCIDYTILKDEGPAPPSSAPKRVIHEYVIKTEAAHDMLCSDPGGYLMFPYPEDLPPGWKLKWGCQ